LANSFAGQPSPNDAPRTDPPSRCARDHRPSAPILTRVTVFFTKAYMRIVCPALAELDPAVPDPVARRTPLGRPWREFVRALDQRIADAALTA
jgi:hypothetical protein